MKNKTYILKPTGEIRPPKIGEYFLGEEGNIQQAFYNFNMGKFSILNLEIIEEQWELKEGDKYFCIDFFYWCVISPIFVFDDAYHKNNIDSGNCFSTKELAEKKLQQIKEILNGQETGK